MGAIYMTIYIIFVLSEAVQIALIVSITTLITTTASLLVSLRNSRKIEEVHKTINSGLSRQLDTAQKLGHLEGMADERDSPEK